MQGKLPTELNTQELINKIKHKIAVGEYTSGEWLKQIDIERAFQVNRFTVRSAFNELTSLGMLQHVPYKGYRVGEHSIQDRIQITEARELLESAAALKVLANIDEAGIEWLQKLAESFHQAVLDQDVEQMLQCNFDFHKAFYSFCNNRYLSEMIDDMRGRGAGNATQGWRKQSTILASSQDHFAMLDALQNKNILQLQSLIHQHLNRWRESYQ